MKSSKDVSETVLNLQAMNGVNNLFKAKLDENDAKLSNQKEAYKMQSIENIEHVTTHVLCFLVNMCVRKI